MSNAENLGEWLDILWGSEPCKVYLAYKNDPSDPRSFTVPPAQAWPANKDKIVQWALGKSAQGKDVYYAVSQFIDETESKHKFVQIDDPDNPGKKKNSDVPNVKGSRALYIDFDGNAAEALAKLEATPDLPRPTARIQSSGPGHEHWYWILDSPELMEAFEPINKRLCYFLDGDTGCWNADRVLRPPFTTNYKPEHKENLVVDFIELNHNRTTLDAFAFLPEVKEVLTDNLHDMKRIPEMSDVFAKYTWNEQFLDLFKAQLPEDRSGGLVRLAYFGAEAGMTDEAIYAVISDADNRWGKFKGRSDRERRLIQIVAKVRVKHPAPQLDMKSNDESMQIVYTFNELFNSEFELEWLVPDLIPKGTTCFISAESGVGKSRFSLQLAHAMSSGTQFLSWPIPQAYKTFYLSLEMGGDELKEFITSLSDNQELGSEISDRFLLAPIGDPLVLDSEEGYNFLEMLIQEHRPDIVFIDALGKLTLEALEQVQAKNINNRLNTLKHKYGTTFMIIHHMRKPSNGDKAAPTQASIYGDQYIITDAAIVLNLWRPENNGHIELTALKSRFRAWDQPIILDGKSSFRFQVRDKGFEDESDLGGETGHRITL